MIGVTDLADKVTLPFIVARFLGTDFNEQFYFVVKENITFKVFGDYISFITKLMYTLKEIHYGL